MHEKVSCSVQYLRGSLPCQMPLSGLLVARDRNPTHSHLRNKAAKTIICFLTCLKNSCSYNFRDGWIQGLNSANKKLPVSFRSAFLLNDLVLRQVRRSLQ